MRAVIVGSGAGGATVAKELATRGLEVVLLERGPVIEEREAAQHYANLSTAVELMRTVCLGGTTLASAGNGVRVLEDELAALGIDLREEMAETEAELGVRPLPDSHVGEGTRRIMAAADHLGFAVKRMPKFIDPARCVPCGKCTAGCPTGAKWTALDYLRAAEQNGAKILANTPVETVLIKDGTAVGVRCKERMIAGDVIVLAAGALETPRLLQRAGLPTSHSLFVDTFVTVGGILQGIKQNREIPMNALMPFELFMLAPHYSTHLVRRMRQRGMAVEPEDILGIMVKIRDDPQGEITDGVQKEITNHDAALLSEGAAIAGVLLEHAGVDPSTVVTTPLRGAHPGGTARIGEAVDRTLATTVSGLYLADASVLPAAPGAPPILTIVALAKYLAKQLIARA
jgi:choline dehydrogenase-like flavoprotein